MQGFEKFAAFHLLESSSSLLSKNHSAIQIETLYRLQDVFFCNDCRPMWKVITMHNGLCVIAHKESATIVTFMQCDWPADCEFINDKLLWTSMSDDEQPQRWGNVEVLPNILKGFKKHRPHIYSQSVALYTVLQTTHSWKESSDIEAEIHDCFKS